jgi:hypothetical protein
MCSYLIKGLKWTALTDVLALAAGPRGKKCINKSLAASTNIRGRAPDQDIADEGTVEVVPSRKLYPLIVQMPPRNHPENRSFDSMSLPDPGKDRI